MNRKQFIGEYAKWLEQGTAALFVGAGLSRAAGYPDWRTLLKEIATDLGIDLDSIHDLAGVAQWYINKTGRQKTRIAQVVRSSFQDVTDVPPTHRIAARLPVRYVWTTNYDKLIERAWELQRRRLDVKAIKSDLSVTNPWVDTTLYKMHGTIDHPAEIVIATDDYELYRRERAGFLQVLNGHLIGLHFLFIGFSFADPNIAHLLGLIRESMGDNPTQHYAIVRKPKRGSGAGAAKRFQYDKARHSHWVADMQRYGINCIEVDEFEDVEALLLDIEAAVASRSVFVSGSYPDDIRDDERSRVEDVATRVGGILGVKKLRLISGFGLTVGSAVLAGVLGQLYAQGMPALDRSLYLRPFPKEIPKGFTKEDFFSRYREDMIQLAGICIFIGGTVKANRRLITAGGVSAEFEAARRLGKVLIPVAGTGGAAAEIWQKLAMNGGAKAAKLPKDVFKRLGKSEASVDEMVRAVGDAIASVRGTSPA